jgi:hypothetical protein
MREVELRIAQREGRLMETAEAVEIMEAMVGLLRTELSTLPARVARDLQLRRAIEAATADILEKVVNIAVQKAESYHTAPAAQAAQ